MVVEVLVEACVVVLEVIVVVVVVVKTKHSLYRPEQALSLRLPKLQDNCHMKVERLFNPIQRPPFTPGKHSCSSFLRKNMKNFRIVRVPPGIRIWYLSNRVKKLNSQFVAHKLIIIIRFKFVLHDSAPLPAIIRYYI